MNKTFTVNNKLYRAREFDFNFLCDLEEQGISLEDIEKKPMSLIRTYLAFCGDLTKEQAGKEVESHVINGNDFTDIIKMISDGMEESGFFRALRQTSETETETDDTETSTPKAKAGKK